MDLIRTSCWMQKPVGGYFRECLEILGVPAKSWLYLIFWSLVLGFGVSYLFLKYKKMEIKSKKSVLVILLAFLIILVLLYILRFIFVIISQIGVIY